jgi:hypothetical protein
MYKTAKELRGHTLADVEVEKHLLKKEGIDHEDMDIDVDSHVMNRKLSASKAKGLHSNIKAMGVLYPVSLGQGNYGEYKRGMVADGHHRIASAFNINPNMLVPVEHQR